MVTSVLALPLELLSLIALSVFRTSSDVESWVLVNKIFSLTVPSTLTIMTNFWCYRFPNQRGWLLSCKRCGRIHFALALHFFGTPRMQHFVREQHTRNTDPFFCMKSVSNSHVVRTCFIYNMQPQWWGPLLWCTGTRDQSLIWDIQSIIFSHVARPFYRPIDISLQKMAVFYRLVLWGRTRKFCREPIRSRNQQDYFKVSIDFEERLISVTVDQRFLRDRYLSSFFHRFILACLVRRVIQVEEWTWVFCNPGDPRPARNSCVPVTTLSQCLHQRATVRIGGNRPLDDPRRYYPSPTY